MSRDGVVEIGGEVGNIGDERSGVNDKAGKR